MKLRILTLAMAAALLSVFVVAPLQSRAAPPSGGTAAFAGLVDTSGTPVNGTVSNLTATFDRATNTTTITGTFTQAVTGATDTFTSTLLQATGSCQILDLVLGPIHLDLLGLVVDLNQVHLNITAQSGSGNLLGNLLCAVAHLLDSNAVGNTLANLLNQIFAILG